MNTLINLSDYGLLKVSGIDAKKLLQGQLTCDVEKAANTESCLGAHCNPQGRIISLFRLFQLDNAYYLLMPRSMLQIALAALKKYAVFYKTELTDASGNVAILGYTGPADKAPLESEISMINISSHQPRYLLAGSPETINALLKQTNTALPITNEWLCLDINDGVPTIYPETTGKFLPHEINLHELNGISFEKGCYTGQEIIARMHYRGKLKSHMYQAKITHESDIVPGQDIYCLQDGNIQPAGTIVDRCKVDHHYQTLILIDKLNAKNHYLFLNQDHRNFFTFKE